MATPVTAPGTTPGTATFLIDRLGSGSIMLDDLAAASGRVAVVVAVALAAYLAVLTALNLWARRSGSHLVQRLAATLTPRFVAIVIAAMAATSSPAAAQTPPVASDGPATALSPRPATGSNPTMRSVVLHDAGRRQAPAMERADVVPGNIPPTMSMSPTVIDRSSTTQVGSTTHVASSTHVVAVGEHLWSIAETVVAAAGGSDNSRTGASTTRVTRYWMSLMAANRSNLVDPDNPDLIVPGQVLVLPPTDLG